MVVVDIMSSHDMGPGAQARIEVIQMDQAKQARSSCSDSRKDRLLTALFRNFDQFNTTVNAYRGLLEKFQGYTKLMQSEKPTLHMYHEQMFSLVKNVLMLFMKSECIPKVDSFKKLLKLKPDISKRDMQVSDRKLSVGPHSLVSYTSALKDPKSCHWARDLAKKLRIGYEKCADMLLEKLPLGNKTILWLSCLHPDSYKDDSFHLGITKLASSLPNVIPSTDMGTLDSEAREYTVDKNVAALAGTFAEKGRIDVDYWAKIFQLKKEGCLRFPVLSRLVKALLSIFTGPLVESSFNLMDDCIRADRSSLLVENYEATALIRSTLKSQKVTSTTMNVTRQIGAYIRTSKGRYNKHMELKKIRKQKEKKRKMQDAVQQLLSAIEKPTNRVIRCHPRAAAAVTCSTASSTTVAAPTASVATPTASVATTTTSAIVATTHSAFASIITTASIAGVKRKQPLADIRGFFKKPNIQQD